MSKKTIVDFIKPWRGYAPGEKAGFDEAQAEALRAAGVATIGGKGAAKTSNKAGAPGKKTEDPATPPASDDPNKGDDTDEKP
jgi:hypothetical protein